MKFFCFPQWAVIVGAAVLLSSCATEEKPAIVRQVETAQTPVQGFVVAIKHFNAVTGALETRIGMVTSSVQLNAAARSLADAIQGCSVAAERMLKMDSMTKAEEVELSKALPLLSQAERRLPALNKIMLHKADKYFDQNTRVVAKEGLYWFTRNEEAMNKLSRKGFAPRD